MSVALTPAGLINPLPYQKENYRSKIILPILQKGLKIASIATAILSLVPPLRLAGNLATRGIALLASGLNGAESWKSDHALEKVSQCCKIAIVILGIVAVAISLPFLTIASIAADLAYNTFEAGRALYHKDLDKALTHLGAIIIDTFALAGLVTGSWKLMLVAGCLSAVAMFALGIKLGMQASNDKKPLDIIDSVCHFIQTGVGIASVASIAEIGIYDNPYLPRKPIITPQDFDKLPIDTTNCPILQTPKKEQPNNPYLNEIEYFCNLELKAPQSCALKETGPGVRIIFTHHPQKIFDHASLMQQIPFLGGYKWSQADLGNENGVKEIDFGSLLNNEKENISPLVEEIFIHYLTYGDVANLDLLAEDQILELYFLADRLTIERLQGLAFKSIANRLKKQEWKNSAILKKAQELDSSLLQTLLNYYDF